jgi:hypothetical protein
LRRLHDGPHVLRRILPEVRTSGKSPVEAESEHQENNRTNAMQSGLYDLLKKWKAMHALLIAAKERKKACC